MFNDVLNQVTGIFDRRFLLNAFFPCLIFWGLLGVVGIIGGGWDVPRLIQLWNQQDVILKVLEIVGIISLVVFSASLLSSQSWSILRFYEGYWEFPLSSRLSKLGKAEYQKNLKQLDVERRMQQLSEQLEKVIRQLKQAKDESAKESLEQERARLSYEISLLEQQQFGSIETVYRYYPSLEHQDEVMPTRLGNILKSSELYPNDRYGIDAVLIWSRVYHVLPDRSLQLITETLSNLHFTLAIATLSGLFSSISGIWLLAVKAPGWLFLVCLWVGSLVAWLAYQSALGNAAAYAEQVKVCFDLYRTELVKQLRLKPVFTPDAERQQWEDIVELFLEGNFAEGWLYVEPDVKKEDAQNG